jgi:hypothetical protein
MVTTMKLGVFGVEGKRAGHRVAGRQPYPHSLDDQPLRSCGVVSVSIFITVLG